MAVRFDGDRKQWIVEFEQKGVRVFQRLPRGCAKSQAEAREAQLRREIYDRETLQKVPPLTLESAINQWLTEDHRRKDRKKMASEAKQWEPYVKGKLLREVAEVAQSALAAWTAPTAARSLIAKERRIGATMEGHMADSAQIAAQVLSHASRTTTVSKRGTRSIQARVTAATINRRLSMMKAVCRHAYKQGRIVDNLSGRITVLPGEKMRERYLTRQEVSALAKSSPSDAARSAITIAAYTGLRASELLALTPNDLRKGTLTVRESKSGKPRVVPVPGPALPSLRALPLPVSYWQLRKDFIVACKKAKLKGVRFHDLRHTAASWLINAGVDLYVVGKILGHSSPQTTARYAHLAHATLKDAMERLR